MHPLTIGNASERAGGRQGLTIFFLAFLLLPCRDRCGCHQSEDDYDIPSAYLTGDGVNNTGAVSDP